MPDPTPPPSQTLGRAIRTQRQRLGLQQTVLADLAGIGVAFVYDLERGKPTVRLDKVLAVLGVLGLGLAVELTNEPLRARLEPGDDARGAAP